MQNFFMLGATLSVASLKHQKMQDFWQEIVVHIADPKHSRVDIFWPLASSGMYSFSLLIRPRFTFKYFLTLPFLFFPFLCQLLWKKA